MSLIVDFKIKIVGAGPRKLLRVFVKNNGVMGDNRSSILNFKQVRGGEGGVGE
jgi:hypothetical protein